MLIRSVPFINTSASASVSLVYYPTHARAHVCMCWNKVTDMSRNASEVEPDHLDFLGDWSQTQFSVVVTHAIWHDKTGDQNFKSTGLKLT